MPEQNDKFFINLDRVPERYDFMESQLRARGLGSVRRWSATDAANADALEGVGYKQGTGQTWSLSRSEIACFESHRAIWRHAVDCGLPAVTIFEDDLLLSHVALEVINKLMASAVRFDVVKLDFSPKVHRFGPAREMNGVTVRPLLSTAVSAGGYILSLQGCKKLLDWSERYSDRLDDFVFMPRPGWRAVQVVPAIGTQLWMTAEAKKHAADILYTSERESNPTINQKPDKGPFLYRLKKELTNGAQRLKWRAWGDAKLKRDGGFVGLVTLASDLIE